MRTNYGSYIREQAIKNLLSTAGEDSRDRKCESSYSFIKIYFKDFLSI